jgi:hypothetical protein
MKELKYSPGSCQKRFIALQNDTASIPPELDDNPLQRLEERAARALASFHQRQIVDATAKHKKEQKRLNVQQEKLKKALEKKDRADKRAHAAEEKARVALEQAAIRNRKAKELEAEREQAEAQIKMLRMGRGIPTPGPPKPTETPSNNASPTRAVTIKTTNKFVVKAKRATLANLNGLPRARMTVEELGNLCVQRRLPKSGTKSTLCKRLAEADMDMGIDSLKKLLCAKNIPTHGSMEELAKRLSEADVSVSAWGKKQLKAHNAFYGTSNSSANKCRLSPEPHGSDPKRVRSSFNHSDTPKDLTTTTTDSLSLENEGNGLRVNGSSLISANTDSDSAVAQSSGGSDVA